MSPEVKLFPIKYDNKSEIIAASGIMTIRNYIIGRG